MINHHLNDYVLHKFLIIFHQTCNKSQNTCLSEDNTTNTRAQITTRQLLQFTKTSKKSGKITCTPNRNLPSRRTQKFFLFEKILSPPTTISRHNRLQFYEICEINKNFFQFFSSFTYSNTQLVKKFPSTLLNVGRPKLVKTHQLDWRMIQGLNSQLHD